MLGGHLYIGFGEMSIQVLCLFFNCFFFTLICGSSLNILDITLLSDVQFADIFSPFMGCFLLCWLSCWCLFLMYSYLCFAAFAFGVISKKSLPNPVYTRFPPVFSFKRFTFTS